MEYLLNLLTGFILGIAFTVATRLFVINKRDKKGVKNLQKQQLSLSSILKINLRSLVFKFSIQRLNKDFLLNIKWHDQFLLQLMHRAHFPELLAKIDDVAFGIAVYIPLKELSSEQKEVLFRILKEEDKEFVQLSYPVQFLVIDIGTSVSFGSYLITRIISEVYGKVDASLELFDEGNLPYLYQNQS